MRDQNLKDVKQDLNSLVFFVIGNKFFEKKLLGLCIRREAIFDHCTRIDDNGVALNFNFLLMWSILSLAP